MHEEFESRMCDDGACTVVIFVQGSESYTEPSCS